MLTAAVVVCAAVALLALLTYWGARTFTRRAADERAAEEAASFATHSSLLATGDAFNGYLQILRYSDDPVVRTPDATREVRRDAMQQLLWLNTNKMDALAIADRSGLVLATTDISIRNVRESEAFNESRANLGPANSDIILPEAGAPGYVEFTAPLRDVDGSVWGFLYARADPNVLWRDTLNATIDGGHNVIINSEGLFSAGVPNELLKMPWRGSPLDNGSVRADIAGTPSICGLGAIGKDTQIDHGWFVASCLPASLIQVEARRALGNQWQITLAGAVLIAVISIGILRLTLGGAPVAPVSRAAVLLDAGDEPDSEAVAEVAGTPAPPDAIVDLTAVPAAPPEHEPDEMPPPPVIVMADVDALRLVEAFEHRNALLSERLRASIQARLMIATARAEEAYRLLETDPERAMSLHRSAMAELESIRERELRSIGQELHPSLVRLGLPGALRSLIKEFEGRISIVLAIGGNVDGGSSRGGRITIDPRLRLIVYRIVRDAVQLAHDAGATEVHVSAQRDGLELVLTIAGDLDDGAAPEVTPLAAHAIALEAFAGHLTIAGDGRLALELRVIAPHVEQPEPDVAEAVSSDRDETAVPRAAADAVPPAPGGDGQRPVELEDDAATSQTPSTFALADGEPRVIDASPAADHYLRALPATATTFRLPDDEPTVVQATTDEDAGDHEPPPGSDDDELPRVVKVASLGEVFQIPPAANEGGTDGSDTGSDAA